MPESILLVEDDPLCRMMTVHTLERAGHRVATAANGREAQHLLSEHKFSLLITDIFMDDMDGLELIRLVHSAQPKLRVIAISAGSPLFDVDFLRYAQLMGASQVLHKPVLPPALLAAVAASEVAPTIS